MGEPGEWNSRKLKAARGNHLSFAPTRSIARRELRTMRRRGPAFAAVMFLVFAIMFSVVLWPKVPLAAKLALFAAGIGCGAGIARAAHRGS